MALTSHLAPLEADWSHARGCPGTVHPLVHRLVQLLFSLRVGYFLAVLAASGGSVAGPALAGIFSRSSLLTPSSTSALMPSDSPIFKPRLTKVCGAVSTSTNGLPSSNCRTAS